VRSAGNVSNRMEFPVPRNLVEYAIREDRQGWLESLPDTVNDVARRWSLLVGEPFQPGGVTAWVAPARGAAGDDLVLKVAWRHPEGEHEADGLREWDGAGAVRVYAAEELGETIVLLIERCVPGTPLTDRPPGEQDTVIAGLLARLWRRPAPGHRFRPLQVMCTMWADRFERELATGRGPSTLDAGLVREGIALFRSLPATTETNVLLCTDLHAGNVLAAEREPWLVIDPKPYIGDPHYDPLQHMLNCEDRLHSNPRDLAERMAGLLDLDTERLVLWLFARCIVESVDWPHLASVARRIAPH
jgi:streptomycin 6-kinase